MMRTDFWKSKSLEEMSPAEWDALCDRCGLCCLVKHEDADSGDIHFLSRSCPFLDTTGGLCLIYADRHRLNPYCVELSADLLPHLNCLPDSCAYRQVEAGNDLPPWHHLVCADADAVPRVGNAAQIKSVSDLDVDSPGNSPAAVLHISKSQPQK